MLCLTKRAVACCLLVALLAVAPLASGHPTPHPSTLHRHLAAHAAPAGHQAQHRDLTAHTTSTSTSNSRRGLQQVPATNSYGGQVLYSTAAPAAQALTSADNKELPRLNIGKVQATLLSSYAWSIQRQSSATGVALTADGYSRKQMGYQLTFTRTLQRRQYRIEGTAGITNPSASGAATLTSLNILIGGREVRPACLGMPATQYVLPPNGVIECPFQVTYDTDPGADAVTGFVQTSFGRAAAATPPVAYDFSNCGSSSSGGGTGSGNANAAASCRVEERGVCVSVTDGSYIVNKYKDKLGQQLAGKVTRSRLFDLSPVQDSNLGPPRVEPTTPAAVAQVASVPDDPPVWKPTMPDDTWWTGQHRRLLLTHKLHPTTTSSTSSGSSSSAGRELLQSQNPKGDLVASFDANFMWPYPTITGDRPPVGLNGVPEKGSQRQICDTRTFSFGMAWGPLLPAACGIFEVQNYAGAVPTDGSSPAVSINTYTHLQVACPAAVAERASRAEAAGHKGG